MAHPSPIHSWKLSVPFEVSAVKFGASSFMRNTVCLLVWCSSDREAGGASFRPSKLRERHQPGFRLGLRLYESYFSLCLRVNQLATDHIYTCGIAGSFSQSNNLSCASLFAVLEI